MPVIPTFAIMRQEGHEFETKPCSETLSKECVCVVGDRGQGELRDGVAQLEVCLLACTV